MQGYHFSQNSELCKRRHFAPKQPTPPVFAHAYMCESPGFFLAKRPLVQLAFHSLIQRAFLGGCSRAVIRWPGRRSVAKLSVSSRTRFFWSVVRFDVQPTGSHGACKTRGMDGPIGNKRAGSLSFTPSSPHTKTVRSFRANLFGLGGDCVENFACTWESRARHEVSTHRLSIGITYIDRNGSGSCATKLGQ